MLGINLADDDGSRFIRCSGRNLKQIRVIPQSHSIGKVDAMFGEVSLTLLRVKRETHNGIENIPFLPKLQAPGDQ